VTTPGHLNGGDARERTGLRGAGPVRVITNLAVLSFDEETKRMQIDSLHPGVRLEQVIENTGFELLIPSEIRETIPPTDQELDLLRDEIDPDGLYIKS